jgi:hypothetical protein
MSRHRDHSCLQFALSEHLHQVVAEAVAEAEVAVVRTRLGWRFDL